MKICLNAGHYPNVDPGAIGKKSCEAEVAKHLTGLIAKYLEAAYCEVLVVQENDLEDIVDASNRWGADLFVSIHCNAFNKEARGSETFHYYGSEKGYALAECIQAQLACSIETPSRGVKQAGFFVLKYSDCPAVLVETAFIDNEEDEQLLLRHGDCFARAIARGVTDYLSSL